MMLVQTVPLYYASLGLQSYMNIRSNFNEEQYVWIEKWIHLTAIFVPCGVATIVAATQNFNPNGSGCWISKAPLGCKADPSIPCERGSDITLLLYIFGMGQFLLYFVFPPTASLAIFIWIKKVQKRTTNCSGMHLIREEARKEMNYKLAVQVTVYLLSFWFTSILNIINGAYNMMTGNMLYNLLILGNTVFASQGFVLAVVYFILEKLSTQKTELSVSQRITFNTMRSTMRSDAELTVHDIRQLAAAKSEGNCSPRHKRVSFHIFDGTQHDPTSPWAEFIDPEDGDTNECKDDAPCTIENEYDHHDDDQV